MIAESLLIQELKEGKPSAQTAFVNKHWRGMRRYCMKITKHEQDAEDAVQEGFDLFFKKIDLLEDRGKGSAVKFLKGFLKHQAAEQVRVRASQRINMNTEIPDLPQPPTIYHMLDYGDIEDIIRNMPQALRTVLLLYDDGYTHKEIAERQNIRESTCRAQLSKARMKLLVTMMWKKLYDVQSTHFTHHNYRSRRVRREEAKGYTWATGTINDM